MAPACAVLEIAPSTYYAAKKREQNPSARDERDEEMKKEIMRVWSGKGRKAYGARKYGASWAARVSRWPGARSSG